MDLPETMHDFLLVFLGSGLLLGSLGVVLLTNPIFSAFSLGLVLVWDGMTLIVCTSIFVSLITIISDTSWCNCRSSPLIITGKNPHLIIVLNLEEFSIQYIETNNQQKKKFYFVVLDLVTDCEISLLCSKKDSYTDCVYSKETLGTPLTIVTQKFNFSKFLLTDLIFYGIDPPLTV
ncbi:hypothetical protein KIW84_066000 [Lathyrus oleraceus]|uniref:Uncharacterized protein n=1 Tax=Pisum sativum TaxID=3888 RepID=A0A9D5AB06_PEA|nr:hypothetical protein KIW84_066000 [Pisum sativum]